MQIKFVDVVVKTNKLSYKNFLTDVSVEVKRGDYVAVIGPNGGGKTTFIKLLLGLLTPSSGTIELFGKKRGDFKDKYKIGYVPQGATRIDDNFPISVEETVSLGCGREDSFFGFFGFAEQNKEIVREAMSKMGVLEFKNRRICELSGGERQRVMIARALAAKPQILILDEPNTGVDTGSQKSFYDLLAKLNKEEKITILFITHDLSVIADSVNKVFCVNKKLLSCHNPRQILSCSDMSALYGIDAHLVCHRH